MSPEEHALWHQRESARMLVKSLRTLANYLFEQSLWLAHENQPHDTLVPRFQQPAVSLLRFSPEQSEVLARTMLKFQYKAQQLSQDLPDDWQLPPLIWRAPPGESAAANMSTHFENAADELQKKMWTLPPEHGWRGLGQRVRMALGLWH